MTNFVPLPYDGGAVFRGDLAQFLLGPLENPERAHPVFNPARSLFAVYGRGDMQQGAAVRAFCGEHGIRAELVGVVRGETTLAVDAIQTLLERAPPAVLIVEHADLLVTDPDCALTRGFALNLKHQFEDARCILVACFDRNPVGGGKPIPEATRAFREQVMSQFPVVFFVPRPPPSYRRALLQGMLEEGAAFLGASVSLSDENYANLETYTAFCTPGEIVRWAQGILADLAYSGREKNPFDALRKEGKPLCITFDLLDVYINNNMGTKHILRFDPRFEENELSVYCGKGPETGNPPPKPKRERTDEEEAERVKKAFKAMGEGEQIE